MVCIRQKTLFPLVLNVKGTTKKKKKKPPKPQHTKKHPPQQPPHISNSSKSTTWPSSLNMKFTEEKKRSQPPRSSLLFFFFFDRKESLRLSEMHQARFSSSFLKHFSLYPNHIFSNFSRTCSGYLPPPFCIVM